MRSYVSTKPPGVIEKFQYAPGFAGSHLTIISPNRFRTGIYSTRGRWPVAQIKYESKNESQIEVGNSSLGPTDAKDVTRLIIINPTT